MLLHYPHRHGLPQGGLQLAGGVLLLALLASLSGLASAQVLMASDTESELAQNVRPPQGVIDLIIKNEPDDASRLEECMANDGGEKIPLAELFSARALQLNNDDLPDYFVRPAIKPYCHAFYGAHLFRFWFVTSYRKNGKISYRLVFKAGGDEVRVLNPRTNGYHDLEMVGHNAIKVATSSWRFDGKKYVVTGCILRNTHPEDRGGSQCL
jgi:hypothetical protein